MKSKPPQTKSEACGGWTLNKQSIAKYDAMRQGVETLNPNVRYEVRRVNADGPSTISKVCKSLRKAEHCINLWTHLHPGRQYLVVRVQTVSCVVAGNSL